MAQIDFLTEEDIQFLRNLAHELKTQGTLGTRKPVFWQIQEKELIAGFHLNYSDYVGAILGNGDDFIVELEEAKEYLIDNYGFTEEDLKGLSDFDDLNGFCGEHNILCILIGYQYRNKYENCFLTRTAIDKHIRENSHHYKDPIRYCNYAWRNPQLEKLLEIIEKFDESEV